MDNTSLAVTLANGLSRRSARAQGTAVPYSGGGGWFNIIREPYAGAFQQNIAIDAPRDILAFSAVFACVTGIATDIAKLGITLKRLVDGIGEPVETSPFLGVLRKPNRFQVWYKFIEQWIVSKLLYGNTYIIKERDGRGVVRALYVLDAQRVTPLVAEDGSVYYRLAKDYLSNLPEGITVPAREIIHDTGVCLWHPLVGVSPIYACGVSATQGNRIQSNSTRFFANASRPSGGLTAPGTIPDETAARLKKEFEENFSGGNIGRIFVAGDGLEYKPMTIPASDAQLIEQLQWTVEDVARCFHYPIWKLGNKESLKQGVTIEALNQAYYSDCLQGPIESAEALLDDGLALPSDVYVEFDLENLLRMDTTARYMAWGKAVHDGWWAPDEARKKDGKKPVPGGASPYLQQQNYSLAALAKRDAQPDPFATKAPPAPAANDDDEDDEDEIAADMTMVATLFVEGMNAI